MEIKENHLNEYNADVSCSYLGKTRYFSYIYRKDKTALEINKDILHLFSGKKRQH